MKSKLIYLWSISALLVMGSCATRNQTAQQVDQNDDVYYSEAKAREEVEVIAQAKPEVSLDDDYVSDRELYGDVYSGDYASRIYRFRNYAPWRGYYNNMYTNMYGYGNRDGYGNMYDSYYDPYYNPYSLFGGPGINLAIGFNNGFYNYNPWRYSGYNYGSNFMGPYSYFSPFGMGYGRGLYGNNGYYGGGYGINRPEYVSPNYRARPTRGSDALPIDPGAVNPRNAGGVIRNGNTGDVIQSSGSRAERYDGRTSTTPSTTRPTATSPRPARVSQQPQRVSQPERIYQPERINTTPPSNNTGGGRSSGESSGGGGRPSRGN